MSTTPSPRAGKRISVSLDPAILVEALIMAHLEALPKRRHPDWIRALLVQGFLAERRIARQLDGSASTGPDRERQTPQPPQSPRRGFVFSAGLGQAPKPRPSGDTQAPMSPETPPRPATGKPFAHLRKVVG
ncbi:MAG: hypothetical protein U5S82_16830 [Gammaproteobacteria bacterium]|nr:hypothetical protein [Gammaproteobacteria bacterium]